MVLKSTPDAERRRKLRLAAFCAGLLAVLIAFRSLCADVLSLILGGALIAFLLEPAARSFERHLNRSASAACALALAAAALLACLWISLPSLAEELQELAHTLPPSILAAKRRIHSAVRRLEAEYRFRLPEFHPSFPPFPAKKTLRWAENAADQLYRLSLMFVLGYFFLKDRRSILVRLELLFPSSVRSTAVCMGNAVCRELKLFLRSQLLICAAVGLLSGIGLSLCGIRPAPILGLLVGLFNIIPYFGPVIGGIPAVLIALSRGPQTALLTLLTLWAVQQIDGLLISPRMMSNLTGFSPAVVLLVLFIGSKAGGMVGMLLTMPIILTIRTTFRVYVQRYESI